jgi:hypothetical protein
MRHVFGVLPFLLAISAPLAVAGPVQYTIDFTLTSGSPMPSSGSFIYNSLTSTFTSFNVVWDGDTFDLTSAANSFPYT